jgi:hypothetical protein
MARQARHCLKPELYRTYFTQDWETIQRFCLLNR